MLYFHLLICFVSESKCAKYRVVFFQVKYALFNNLPLKHLGIHWFGLVLFSVLKIYIHTKELEKNMDGLLYSELFNLFFPEHWEASSEIVAASCVYTFLFFFPSDFVCRKHFSNKNKDRSYLRIFSQISFTTLPLCVGAFSSSPHHCIYYRVQKLMKFVHQKKINYIKMKARASKIYANNIGVVYIVQLAESE